MRNNDIITLVIDKRDLADVLESLGLTISKMEKAQEALKDAADLIRTVLQAEDTAKADCENGFLPRRHNPNSNRPLEDELDDADYELLEQLREVTEAVRKTDADLDEAKKELRKDTEPEAKETKDIPENTKCPGDGDEAESLAIELMKAVFSTLTELIDKED